MNLNKDNYSRYADIPQMKTADIVLQTAIVGCEGLLLYCSRLKRNCDSRNEVKCSASHGVS